MSNHSGLLVHLRFDEEANLVKNSISKPAKVKVEGAQYTATGHRKGSLSFDQDDDMVTVSELNFTGDTVEMTIACWLKTDMKKTAALFSFGLHPNRLFYVDYHGDEGRLDTTVNSQGFHLVGPTSVNDGAWHHFVMVVNKNEVVHYVDGKEDGRKKLARPLPMPKSRTLEVGGFFYPDKNSILWEYRGSIDELMIFNSALGPAEVAAISKR